MNNISNNWKRPNSWRRKLLVAQNGRCCYCRKKVRYDVHFNKSNRATVEHLQRRVDGGLNTPDNRAIACKPCNNDRGATNWLEYATLKEFIHERCRI